ncbi:MAG TPA: TonB-dependent receptor [Puia sp.]|nr:TonB-dependent receptor [Puia sp.]
MKIITTLFLLGLTGYLHAQTQIKGSVQEENKSPLEAASISLIKGRDSLSFKYEVSDKDGKFSFPAIPPGIYHIRISAIGHIPVEEANFTIVSGMKILEIPVIILQKQNNELASVAVVGKKPFIEQKSDRILVNVDASPANAGTSVMDVLEKSPGVSVDKDGNISLKGKQGVTIMIDNRPTYMSGAQLSVYLKSLPSSAIDQLEIMSNPSSKYDAAGNSGIINIKTKKNKAKGFNGSTTLTYTQGKYAKPGGSLNLNYRVNKFNLFFNGGYTYWQGFQQLDINRNYLDPGTKNINSIFTQSTHMKFLSPELNLKLGMDYFLDSKTTLGVVFSGYQNNETDVSQSYISLKNSNNVTDSLVQSFGNIHGIWSNGTMNLNFRRQFDSTGRELTADADYIYYKSGSNQLFQNYTYDPDMNLLSSNTLSGDLPSTINIYSFKTDYTHPFRNDFKLEAGLKTSFVATDNKANYYDVTGEVYVPDTTKTNYFVYHENINAAYINLTKKYGKWNLQAGLRVENTNYDGHQYGNIYTINNNDSSFKKSYVNAFPTAYITYDLNSNNSFNLNFGRRIDRPDYGDLNPFLFFLDEYTYQAGNPYLQPQLSTNIELSHTYKNKLTTTLNYSNTQNFFAETFEQDGHATIVRRGNIGRRENGGIAVSLNMPLTKWWNTTIYLNVNYNHFTGELYGENLNVSAVTGMGNMTNQFKFTNGWSAELSGWYRTSGIEGQIMVQPMGQTSAAIAKQIMKDKASLKLGLRDIFYTQQVKGTIDFQETEATFHNSRDSRQLSLTFTYRFGKVLKGPQNNHHSGGADDESNRLKKGGNN